MYNKLLEKVLLPTNKFLKWYPLWISCLPCHCRIVDGQCSYLLIHHFSLNGTEIKMSLFLQASLNFILSSYLKSSRCIFETSPDTSNEMCIATITANWEAFQYFEASSTKNIRKRSHFMHLRILAMGQCIHFLHIQTDNKPYILYIQTRVNKFINLN